MRIAIFGNSGSGKTTLARALAEKTGAAMLDLDILVGEPQQVAVRRDSAAVRVELERFCTTNEAWVIEGCYGELIEAALPWRPELVFLNPGLELCLQHCRARPHEAHKFATSEEQDAHLKRLLDWVADYYVRDDSMSLKAHRRIFDAYRGPKREIAAHSHTCECS